MNKELPKVGQYYKDQSGTIYKIYGLTLGSETPEKSFTSDSQLFYATEASTGLPIAVHSYERFYKGDCIKGLVLFDFIVDSSNLNTFVLYYKEDFIFSVYALEIDKFAAQFVRCIPGWKVKTKDDGVYLAQHLDGKLYIHKGDGSFRYTAAYSVDELESYVKRGMWEKFFIEEEFEQLTLLP